jgi:hypothetical protein
VHAYWNADQKDAKTCQTCEKEKNLDPKTIPAVVGRFCERQEQNSFSHCGFADHIIVLALLP